MSALDPKRCVKIELKVAPVNANTWRVCNRDNFCGTTFAWLDEKFAAREIQAMGQIDRDALNHFETQARMGAVDALFQLGIAYASGQGAPADLVAAHKWFNLAAMKGTKEALTWRSEIALEMSAKQIADAQREAREWLRA